jgi:LysM repeat protein
MFIVKTAAAAALLAFASTSALAAAAACARSYKVVAGDTCDAITAAQKVSTYQLTAANPSINAGCTNLEIGQDLCLGVTGSDCTDLYTVKNGDYCDKIGQQTGVNSTLIMLNNPQIDTNCFNLYIGEILCVAKTVMAAPVPPNYIDPTPPNAVPATPQPAAAAAPIPQPAAPAPPMVDDDLPFCDELPVDDPDYGYL